MLNIKGHAGIQTTKQYNNWTWVCESFFDQYLMCLMPETKIITVLFAIKLGWVWDVFCFEFIHKMFRR